MAVAQRGGLFKILVGDRVLFFLVQGFDFFVDLLGFRVSDWIEDFFVFLRCGPDHHTVNFVTGKSRKMHHMAFELKDWSHMQQACELLGKKRIPIIWGPGRHTAGHNLFTYHRNPDDQIVELFGELDVMKDESLGYFEPRRIHLCSAGVLEEGSASSGLVVASTVARDT